MATYRELQFDAFCERRLVPDLAPLDTPGLGSLQGSDVVAGFGGLPTEDGEISPASTPTAPIITQVNIGEFIGDNAVSFDKLNIRFIFPNQDLQSSNFVSGSAGWRIQGNGDVEFNDGTFRGALTASTIDIGNTAATSFHVDIDGNFWTGAATFAAAPFSVTNLGVLVASSGTIGGFSLGSDFIRDVANSFGLASTVTGGDDVRLWAGDTFANRATAPFRVTEAGALTSTSGAIAAFTIALATISATNLTLTSGAANTANITVGTGSNAGGLNSANAAGDIVIWAGDTFANRATAPFRVTAAGAITGSNITITGGTISSTTINLQTANTKNFTGTRQMDAASGAVTYAHGLGKSPVKVRITAFFLVANGNATVSVSEGAYDGTTTSCVFYQTDTTDIRGTSTNIVEAYQSTTLHQKATVAVDATNVTLTWTRTGATAARTLDLLFEVLG